MEIIETDILIIGGGLAAIMAALEASELSSSILLVSKGTIGKSGATYWAGANFAAVLPDGIDNGDSIQCHIDDTYTGGGCLNDLRLLNTLVENAPADLLHLENLGVNFLKRKGRFDLRKPPGHRNPRTVYTLNERISIKTRGRTITDPLRNAITKKNINKLERVSIVRLVLKNGLLAGAVGLNRKNGGLIAIACKAAVIACGGAGSIYEMNTNPADLTGDSYALALKAGCLLRDMEFVQFFPSWHLDLPRVCIHTSLFSDGAVLRNKDGYRFLAEYEPKKMESSTRDTVSLAIFNEIKQGRGIKQGVYADLTPIPKELMAFRFPDFLKRFREHGIDLQKNWIRVAPAAHFFMGGIVIDEHCRTLVQGLFAAGEATGGVHGANRLSGNGLSDPLVFGRIAGREAALYAGVQKKTKRPKIEFSLEKNFAGGELSKEEIGEIKRKIKKLMTKKVGIVRSRTSLSQVHEELESLRNSLDQGQPALKENLPNYFDVRAMLISALAVTKSAICREESRGAHFRDDFSTCKQEMAKSIYVKLDSQELKASFIQ